MKWVLFTMLLCAVGPTQASAQNEISQQLLELDQDQRNAALKCIIGHIGILVASSVFAFATGVAVAQDPTQVDAKHYRVTFENDQVRILQISYRPHAEIRHARASPIPSQYCLTDGRMEVPHAANIYWEERDVKAGQSVWNIAGKPP